MRQIFKLTSHCQYVTGKNGSCLYNLLTGDIYSLSLEYISALSRYDQKTNSFDLLDKYNHIYKELEMKDMGVILDRNFAISAINEFSSPMYDSTLGLRNLISVLYIEITNKCNLDCLFCDTEQPNNRSTACKRFKVECENILEYSDYKSLLLQAKNLGVKDIVLIGGEPLLKDDCIHNIANLCVSNNLNLTIFTNGSIPISARTMKILNGCNTKMIIQVIASNNRDYERIAKKPYIWDKIVQNINTWKSNGLDCLGQLLVGNFNEKQLSDITNKLTQLNLSFITKYIMKYPINKYNISDSNNIMQPKYKLTRIDPFIYSENLKHHVCFANMLSVSCDGKYMPCPSFRINLGKVKDTTMNKVLKSEKYGELKLMCKDVIEGCKHCKYRYGCIECRAVEYSATGKLNGIKNCDILNEF